MKNFIGIRRTSNKKAIEKLTWKYSTGESVKGEKNPYWKGDKATHSGLHSWIRDNFDRPSACEICGTKTAKQYDWSNKDHKYRRTRKDWQYVCRKCHMSYDIKHNNRKMPWSVIAEGKWSRSYNACIECGTTEIKHGARGKCMECYKREYYQNTKHAVPAN